MTGGTFNKIIGIKVIDPNKDRTEQLILRVPRVAWMSRPDHEVAVLRHVRQQSSVLVSNIKAIDLKLENPIKDPYAVQSNEPPPDPELLEIKRILEETIGDNFLR